MRWSLRNQLLIPFGVIVLLAVGSVSTLTSVLAARSSTRQALSQLRTVTETLSQAPFPLSEPVLQKMHGLSGAHFVAFGWDGRLFAASLPLNEVTQIPEDLPRDAATTGWDHLGDQAPLLLGESRYLVAAVEPAANPSVRRLLVLFPEQSWSKLRRDAALPPLVVGLVAGLLTAGVAVWLSQRFGKRIEGLQEQVAGIASGNFRQIPVDRRRDELDELITSVNQMSAQLAGMRETIRQSERSRLLTQLAGGLAHHLRNAATGARMALQLHERRCRQPAASGSSGEDRSLSVALRQLSLMETHLKGVLALGRLEPRPRQPHDIAALLADIVLLVQPACEHAGGSLETTGFEEAVRHGPVHVPSDVASVRAAVLNLLLNAIEAAGGGVVELELVAAAGQVAVEVRDNGPGPPADLAESLLEPFVTSKPEGVGLGLALARQVAEDHGGGLIWRREENRTCFKFSLPCNGDSVVVQDKQPVAAGVT